MNRNTFNRIIGYLNKEAINYNVKKPTNTLNNKECYKNFCKKLGNILTDKEYKWWVKHYKNKNFYESLFCVTCGKRLAFKNNTIGYSKHCSKKCTQQDKKVRLRYEKSMLRNHGVRYTAESPKLMKKMQKTKYLHYTEEEIQKKREKTNKAKYGVISPLCDNTKTRLKRDNTCIERYGTPFVSQNITVRNKVIKTNVKRYGGINWNSSKEGRKRSSEIQSSYAIKLKKQRTHKINNSFNTSKPEEECYKLLCKKLGKRDIIRQYSSTVYPYSCDFYIKSKDIYVEYQGSWTHGGRKYTPKRCEDMLKLWKSKAKQSNFYKQAIYVWTNLDVKKRKCATKNGLNFVELWNLSDCLNFIERL